MTQAVTDLRSKTASTPKQSDSKPEPDDPGATQGAQAPGIVPRWLHGRRGEVVTLVLVLIAVAIFFAGYSVGMHDETFHTYWYSPLRGTGAAPLAVASVQGGAIDNGGNTPLMVTVRGLRILAPGKGYVLYAIHAGRSPERCGFFAVGKGTTQARFSCPGLPVKPKGWLITTTPPSPDRLGKILLRSPLLKGD